jgi:PAS domain S-box-containing protein
MIQKKTGQTNGPRPARSRNNSESKRAEQDLRDAKEFAEGLLAAMRDGLSVLDSRGVHVHVNSALCKMTGFSSEELIGAGPPHPYWPPEELEEIERAFQKTMGSQFEDFQLTFMRKNGERFPVIVSPSRTKDPQGNVVHYFATVKDITERKRAEEASRRRTHELGERFKELTCLHRLSNLLQNPGISLDEILRATTALLRPAWQYPKTACGRIMLEGREFATESFRQTRWRQACDIVVHGERSGIVEVCYLEERPESDEGPFLKQERILIDAIAERLGRVIEHKRAEEALRASEVTYRSIFNATNDGILVLDTETGQIVDANATFLNVLGYTPEEVRGLLVGDISSGQAPYIQEGALRLILEAASGEPQRFEWLAKSRDGGLLWIDVTLKRANIAGWDRVLAVGRDITERKRAEKALRESETKFRTLMETTAASMFIYRGTRPLYINAAMERLTGYTREEILAGELWQLVHPDFQSLVRERSRARQQGEQPPSRYEFKIVTKSGDERWVDFTAGIIELEGHRAAIGTFYDITERKRAEEALQESEQRYRLLAENVTDVIWTADMDLNLTYVSPSVVRLRGYSPDEIVALPFEQIVTPSSLNTVRKALAEALAAESREQKDLSRSRTLELDLYRGDGSTVWVEAQMTFLRDPDGHPVGILGISRDITGRKRAEQELRDAKESAEGLLAAMQDGLSVLDSRGVHVQVNPALCEMTGFSTEELIGVGTPHPYWPAEEYEEIERAFQKTLRGQFRDFELTFMRKNGERFPVILSPSWTKDQQGNVVHYFATVKDITGRKRAEEALRESEQRFRTLSEASFEGIAIHRKGTMLEANQALAAMFGYELSEVIGMHALDFTAPESRDLLLHNIVSGYQGPFESTGLRKDGSTFPVEVCGRPIPYQGKMVTVAALRDITERKQAEEALQKAREELEARVERQMERGNPYRLSFRELTVLHVVAAGKADKEIGSQLGISTLTASKHLGNILSKMGAASRTEACVRALREGLLD